MPINKGLGGFCFLKSVKDEIITKRIFFVNRLVTPYVKKNREYFLFF